MKTQLTLSMIALPIAALLFLSAGCDVPEIESPAVAPAPTVTKQVVEEPTVKEGYLPDGRLDMSGVPGEPPPTTSIPRKVVAKDPKQGKLTRRDGGALGTHMQAIPWVKNKTIFDMIDYNLRIYEAEKSHYPRSHEDFMKEYLPQYYPAALPLPELEPGDEYIYDPEDHTLKIYRPEGGAQ